MPMDMNEAREIVEDAKKRGLIRAPGEAAAAGKPDWKTTAGNTVLPDWLEESIQNTSPRIRAS
jgi:hypothetical protein